MTQNRAVYLEPGVLALRRGTHHSEEEEGRDGASDSSFSFPVLTSLLAQLTHTVSFHKVLLCLLIYI